MNRAQRRQLKKDDRVKAKPKYSLIDVQRATKIALQMRQLTKGHLFTKASTAHCVFCGKKGKGKTECEYWFLTFLDRQQVILINPDYFDDEKIKAFWLMAADEYTEVRIPKLED